MEHDFEELGDKELKDIEMKIKRKIEELYLKPTTASINAIDKFGQEEMMKKRSLTFVLKIRFFYWHCWRAWNAFKEW